MVNRVKQLTTALILSVFIAPLSSASQSGAAYEDLRRLLLEQPIVQDETLTALFSIGDARIQDLIRALDDPNIVVRRNAQIVIRYLGNDTGMKTLIECCQNSPIHWLAVPVPLPLRDWDYEYIRKRYLQKSAGWDQRADSYIYALALDGGPKATALLSEWTEQMEKGVIPHYYYALYEVKAIQSKELLAKETDLAKLVVDNAFFISSEDREHALARLMGFNHAKDKALIKVNVRSVRLGNKRYHIVLERRREGWSFFSVTLVAVS